MDEELNDEESSNEPIEVPYTQLSDDALRGVVEEFITREGTEYGLREFKLDTKVQQVLKQLERGDAKIYFDPEAEAIHIVASNQS